MSVTQIPASTKPGAPAAAPSQSVERYGCGPIDLSGSGHALYERHLVFDNVIDVADAGTARRRHG